MHCQWKNGLRDRDYLYISGKESSVLCEELKKFLMMSYLEEVLGFSNL